jgi:hypothetical protein
VSVFVVNSPFQLAAFGGCLAWGPGEEQQFSVQEMISAAYLLLCLPALADAFIPSGISRIAPRGCTRLDVAHAGRTRPLGLRMVASPPEAEGTVSLPLQFVCFRNAH